MTHTTQTPPGPPTDAGPATLTGILDLTPSGDGRVLPLEALGAGPIEAVTPAGRRGARVPRSLGDRLQLRSGLEVTVTIADAPQAPAPDRPQRGKAGKKGRRRGSHPARDRRTPEPTAVVREILQIEGRDARDYEERPAFEDLTVVDPQPRLTLEYPGCPDSCRLIDLFCPIGRGTRGLIIAPPKAGKTTLLKDITGSILRNHENVEIIVMLIDERPEEVTDFRRTFTRGSGPRPVLEDGSRGEPEWDKPWDRSRIRIIASSNDHDTERHIQVATAAIERGKRLCEAGRHCVIVLDSITRLARAFNRSNRHANSGRTLSGGIDSRALEVPRQIFGAARNTEDAGSLTILGSCLVETGSQGDQVIFEEFKGAGNMELVLDRKISERRLFPAINLAASGTRKEDLLMDEKTYGTVSALRRRMMNMPPPQQVEQLLAAMKRFESNATLVGSAG